MLKVEREVRAVQSYLVMAEGVGEWFAQIGADNVFVAELGTHSSASQLPVKVRIEIDAEDVGAVIVEGHFFFCAAYQFESVVRAIPVDSRSDVEPTGGYLTLHGGIYFSRLFVLFVELRTIERV